MMQWRVKGYKFNKDNPLLLEIGRIKQGKSVGFNEKTLLR